MTGKKKSQDAPAALAGKFLKARKAGRDGYQRADRILQQIAREVKIGEEFAINESGRKAKLIDKFEGASIVWTPCAARRYELEIIEP